MFITVTLIALCLVTGYAATVWTLQAVAAMRLKRWPSAAGTGILALALVATTVIIAASLVNHPFDLPRGSAALLLVPIIGIPAALRQRESLKLAELARRST